MKPLHKYSLFILLAIVTALLVFSPHGPSPSSTTQSLSAINKKNNNNKRNYRVGHDNHQQKTLRVPDEDGSDNTQQQQHHHPAASFDHHLDEENNKEDKKEATALEEIILPLAYPVHRQLPSRQELIRGLEIQRSKQCNTKKLIEESPLLQRRKKNTNNHNNEGKNKKGKNNINSNKNRHDKNHILKTLLEKQFETTLSDEDEPLFYSEYDDEVQEKDSHWWIPFSKDSYEERQQNKNSGGGGDLHHALTRLPCTEEVQRLLRMWQQPGSKEFKEEDPNDGGGGGENGENSENHQRPQNNHDNNDDYEDGRDDRKEPEACQSSTVKGLVSPLKSGAHGVGSAITLLAHDFLSAILLGRRLVVGEQKKNKRWFFAPEGCQKENGWECLFLPATTCFRGSSNSKNSVYSVKSISSSHAQNFDDQQFNKYRLISKSAFDIPGLSRNEYPTIDRFFDTLLSVEKNAERKNKIRGKCIPLVKSWAGTNTESNNNNLDATERILMGTFKAASDPVLVYELAQATAYLMRGVQPWFKQVIRAHLRRTMMPGVTSPLLGPDENDAEVEANNNNNDKNTKKQNENIKNKNEKEKDSLPSSIIFVHDRGEIAKYREYYNSFGCHKIGQDGYLREVTDFLCPLTKDKRFLLEKDEMKSRGAADFFDLNKFGPNSLNPCTVFVSGNMPHAEYELFKKRVEETESRYEALRKHQHKNYHPMNSNNDEEQQQKNEEGENEAAENNAKGDNEEKFNHQQILNKKRRNNSNNKKSNEQDKKNSPLLLKIHSTWNLTSKYNPGQGGIGESSRWGASHPAASWIDLFAGMHSTAWACVVQSNWCRVIDFVRMTLMKRASCPFVDMGIASLSDGVLRQRYCIVKDEWPKKPFSSVIKRNFKLP